LDERRKSRCGINPIACGQTVTKEQYRFALLAVLRRMLASIDRIGRLGTGTESHADESKNTADQ
jgi:hypothetical protein